MWKNYFKIAYRSLLKWKLYSVINLLGLSIGTACCVLIMLYIKEEWTFDQFHQDVDSIYRAWVKEHLPEEEIFNTVTPLVLGPTLKDQFPELEYSCRITSFTSNIQKEEEEEPEPIYMVDADFFQIFDFKLLEGEAKSVLNNPNSIVITEAIAKKYFGKPRPLEESLSIQIGNDYRNYIIKGIVAKPPSNSSLQFNILLPFSNDKWLYNERQRQSWGFVIGETYFKVRSDADIAQIEQKVASFIDQKLGGMGFRAGEYQIGFQPFIDIHLNNEYPVGIVPVSDWRYTYILSAIALLILILASINFTTLSIGRSFSRALEVGIRKVVGASRSQLIGQYWTEAIFIAFLAVIIGIGLAKIGLPLFNNLTSKQLSFHFDFVLVFFLTILVLITGLLSGIYPALVISGFSPLKALNGAIVNTGNNRQHVLRFLVGVQFMLSIGLIACTFIMRNQLRYLQNKNLGFKKENVLVVPYSVSLSAGGGLMGILEDGRKKSELLIEELEKIPNVLKVTAPAHRFGVSGWMTLGYNDPSENRIKRFKVNAVDNNYLTTMGIELEAGRNFSSDVGTDQFNSVIVNSAFARMYDWINPVGQKLPEPFSNFQVIGLTKDFHFNSLHSPIEPLLLVLDPVPLIRKAGDINIGQMPNPKVTIRVAPQNLPQTIANIKDKWQELVPDQKFDFSFLDETINQQYSQEAKMSKILLTATIMAILIACLGLFGMATLVVARRTKEIGIRKVMGASTSSIMFMLNWPFAFMMIVATLLASPFVWYFMNKWLQDFAYHVKISPFTFFIAGLSALIIALLTISYQSLRAALSNPVEALRYE